MLGPSCDGSNTTLPEAKRTREVARACNPPPPPPPPPSPLQGASVLSVTEPEPFTLQLIHGHRVYRSTVTACLVCVCVCLCASHVGVGGHVSASASRLPRCQRLSVFISPSAAARHARAEGRRSRAPLLAANEMSFRYAEGGGERSEIGGGDAQEKYETLCT